MLDGITFVLALLAVVIAPWQKQIQHLQQAVVSERTPWAPRSTIRRGMQLWQRSWSARSALLLTGIAAFVYAGLEVLFPAWVSLAYPPERMGAVLLVGAFGYLIGFAAWRWRLGRCWRSALLVALLIQALILMGSGLQAFADRDRVWMGAVLVFSCGLPVVMAALHQAWVELAPREALPRYFALRYGCEWSTRLVAFLAVPLLIDRLLRPAMSWSIWPFWLMDALGKGPGREMAIAMGGLGWLIVIAIWIRSYWLRDRLRSTLGMRS